MGCQIAECWSSCALGVSTHVITSAMSTAITADRKRVWRALTTPDELIRWDSKIVALLDPIPDFPKPGQQARWRYRVGSVAIVIHQTVQEARLHERLQSEISLGQFRFDETYTLVDEVASPDRTRLTLRIIASNSTPLIGGELDRFDVRQFSAQLVDSRLRSVQKWCENDH
jgi:uncharacterized protein YndB with AHSA1/START domain